MRSPRFIGKLDVSNHLPIAIGDLENDGIPPSKPPRLIRSQRTVKLSTSLTRTSMGKEAMAVHRSSSISHGIRGVIGIHNSGLNVEMVDVLQ